MCSFKSLHFTQHLLIYSCTTVSGVASAILSEATQSQEGPRRQRINTATLHSPSGQELTNAKSQEKPRESRTWWLIIPLKDFNIQTRLLCGSLEGQIAETQTTSSGITELLLCSSRSQRTGP